MGLALPPALAAFVRNPAPPSFNGFSFERQLVRCHLAFTLGNGPDRPCCIVPFSVFLLSTPPREL